MSISLIDFSSLCSFALGLRAGRLSTPPASPVAWSTGSRGLGPGFGGLVRYQGSSSSEAPQNGAKKKRAAFCLLGERFHRGPGGPHKGFYFSRVLL